MKRLAIIIAGYNCGNHIRKCLNSIIYQIESNDKIIFIDDGSTDSTSKIIKKDFPQIHYVFQENAGVSAARNRGLDLANEYQFIMFVDSDDWLEEKCLSEFQFNEKMPDFSFSDWIEYRTDTRKNNRIIKKKCSINNDFEVELTVDDLRKHFLRSRSGGSPWGKVYANYILKHYGIRFTEGLPYAEDYLFNLEYLKYADSIRYIPKGLYGYNCILEGAAAKFRENRCELTIQIEKKKLEIYDGNHDIYMPLILAEMVEQFAIVVRNFYNSEFPKSRRRSDKEKAQQFLTDLGVGISEILATSTDIKAKLLCCTLFI